MEIKKTNCRLCKVEKTEFGFQYYDDLIPICEPCIRFIKSLHKKDYSQTTQKGKEKSE